MEDWRKMGQSNASPTDLSDWSGVVYERRDQAPGRGGNLLAIPPH